MFIGCQKTFLLCINQGYSAAAAPTGANCCARLVGVISKTECMNNVMSDSPASWEGLVIVHACLWYSVNNTLWAKFPIQDRLIYTGPCHLTHGCTITTGFTILSVKWFPEEQISAWYPENRSQTLQLQCLAEMVMSWWNMDMVTDKGHSVFRWVKMWSISDKDC